MMASNFFLSISAQIQPGPPQRLWEAAAPGALGDADQDIPTITPYLVSEDQRAASHAGVIIFPGGGYGGLAGHEGQDYAQWFNQQGISAFVVKYRLGTHGYRHPVMLQDAARAVRFVRHHATKFHVNASRIGIIGSSAGGHLSSTLLTHFDNGSPDSDDPMEKLSSRPDFGILCYPVITMGPETHQGSKNNLLGKDPDPSLVWYLSNEKQVSPQTPPLFSLAHCRGQSGFSSEFHRIRLSPRRCQRAIRPAHLSKRSPWHRTPGKISFRKPPPMGHGFTLLAQGKWLALKNNRQTVSLRFVAMGHSHNQATQHPASHCHSNHLTGIIENVNHTSWLTLEYNSALSLSFSDH